ncbi:MAG TPA: DUF4268 domain-containing protein [Fimbriimonadaceae bacterium]|jgi:hypothetical protein
MEIGKRNRVDVRTLWPKEPQFSDWLITDPGLDLLATDLGIQIENTRRECRPGDFPCDIVGNVLGDENHVVVIENQYGKTNHDHLGKLLTYAAAHKAMTGVWICEQVADDHREVIDWLNVNTPATVSLFLAELKAYRIGTSAGAPQLDVVCRPNLTQKSRFVESDADRQRHAWRKSFWEEIVPFVERKKPPFNLQRPSTDHWSSISVGRSGFNLAMLLVPRTQSIGIELYINCGTWKDSAFQQLQQEKGAIEHELDSELLWKRMGDKKSARILLESKIDPLNEQNRETIKEWFAEWSVRMYNAFKPRVHALKQTKEDASAMGLN